MFKHRQANGFSLILSKEIADLLLLKFLQKTLIFFSEFHLSASCATQEYQSRDTLLRGAASQRGLTSTWSGCSFIILPLKAMWARSCELTPLEKLWAHSQKNFTELSSMRRRFLCFVSLIFFSSSMFGSPFFNPGGQWSCPQQLSLKLERHPVCSISVVISEASF